MISSLNDVQISEIEMFWFVCLQFYFMVIIWGLCQVLIFHFYLCRPKTNTSLWYICLTFGLGLLMLFCSTLMTVFFKWWKYSLTIERPLLLENACRVLYSLGQVRKSVLCSNCFYFIVLKCTLKYWPSSYDYQINIYSIWLLIIKSSYTIFYIF